LKTSIFNALLLADARLPTGSYSYSGGLEPAVMAGMTADEVYPYMLARLRTVVRLETGACVQAHRLATDAASTAAYARLDTAVDARTPSAAQREASRALGRALLRLGESLVSEASGVIALHALDAAPTRGTSLGVLAAALEVDERQSAEICCYEDLQSVAAAALKLLPVTPATVTRWVIDAGSDVADVVRLARSIREPAELPAFSAPWMEYHAEAHVLNKNRRLFVA
jgi:urease accessory protein